MKLSTTNCIPVLLFSLFVLSFSTLQAQSVYATMATEDAVNYQEQYPNDVQILSSLNDQSAVILSDAVTEIIRENVRTHGPGYIFKPTQEAAFTALRTPMQRGAELEYSITEDALVQTCLDLVDHNNITETILTLENYGTRYHTKPQARQAVMDMQAKWDAMIQASGRTDVRTRIFEHVNTTMPSVILTIDGADSPDEFVIVGGHMDSTAWDKDDAPGADDNASGMASLTEMVRVLLEVDYVPSRSVEIMGYAAEEIGLVGSAEVAENYAQNGVNVLAYVQFDMTGYKGSDLDVWVSLDWYNSSDVNNYLVALMDHYNSEGNDHSFTYGFTECGYGCSDHASWANNGYKTAFPFEADFDESNQNIHTPFDTYSYFNTGEHAAKFAKLGLEFIIEGAKSEMMSVGDFDESSLLTYTRNKNVFFDLRNTVSRVNDVVVYTMAGQKVVSKDFNSVQGQLNMEQYPKGVYLLKFVLDNHHVVTKKFVLN